MKRRRVLLGTTIVLAGVAGCSDNRMENKTNSPTNSPSQTLTPSETPTSPPATSVRETVPTGLKQEWSLDRDDDWTERRRLTEYPDSDDAVDWTPDYARTAEYAHESSREEFAATVGSPDVPPLICAVASKWALPTDFSNTSVGLVAEVREWFETQFVECPVSVLKAEHVEPSTSELESGQIIGRDPYEAEGYTDRLKPPFTATIDGESVEVARVSYAAECMLFGLVGSDEQVGYLVGGAWPASNDVTVQTVKNGEMDVSATVSGESWRIKNRLVGVLEDIDQG